MVIFTVPDQPQYRKSLDWKETSSIVVHGLLAAFNCAPVSDVRWLGR